ncbi:hypothetical protein D3C85_1368290 [compost metagenome]
MLQHVLHVVVVMEQAIAVQTVQPALFYLPGGRHKAVCADDLEILFVPQNQMQIVIVITIGVAAFAASLVHRAKGDFT